MSKQTAKQLQFDIRKQRNPAKAQFLQRFFRTGPGEYAAGDIFLGLTVPQSRSIAKKYRKLPLKEIEKVLKSKFHEERLAALVLLDDQFIGGDDKTQEDIYKLYLRNFKHINNWDLVDVSAHIIVGGYLKERDRRILFKWAKSSHLWTRRISVVANLLWIKKGDFQTFLKIAALLLKDEHDLIHKSVGWLLREVGKSNRQALDRFLNRYASQMPRTMLRYSLEKHTPAQRRKWMNA